MDDEVAVGVLDGLADFEKEREDLVARTALAVGVDGDAVDQLEYEIGTTVFGFAAIDEAGDEGVLEAGKGLTLLLEASASVVGVEAVADDLEGDLLMEIVLADSGVNVAHASLAKLVLDAITLKARARADRAVVEGAGAGGRPHHGADRGLDTFFAGPCVFQKRGYFGEDFGIADG